MMRFLNRLGKSKLERLLSEGIVIEATVIKLITEPFRGVMIIRAIAETKILGRTYHFRSEMIWEEEDIKIDKGDTVRILTDKANPKKYYFDPDQKAY